MKHVTDVAARALQFVGVCYPWRGAASAAQAQPQPRNDTQWIQNTISCARIGGPVLGAICGVLTPSPAY